MLKKLIPAIIITLTLNACSNKINQTQILNDLKEISSDKYEGRATGTKGGALAARFITDRFQSLGLQAFTKDYEMPFSFKTRKGEEINGKNIIGFIKGKSEKAIVISAHYDHLGIKNGVIYNGADDDASGISAILAYAAYFSKNKPEHTLIFAAFDAEEMGLTGSKKFVENPPVDLENISLNINLDMIGRNDKNELFACGTFHNPQLKPFIFSKNNKPKIILGHDDPKLGSNDWTNQSRVNA
ncbi:M20/M25/M40 family metallo-hydrolase [Pedobacter alpinus]|uniref:M20/M25/M40 family metallo-hydrolase n=1 Tax=Pedobacter alpinus TaxID=1590643 RepID=A0ABW5TZ02_9SPHI